MSEPSPLPSAVPELPAQTPLICGPTAGGKSTLAVDLAIALREQHNIAAEIVTADAFQVYEGLDIGTAKPVPGEQRGVRHHLINIIDPKTGALSASEGHTSPPQRTPSVSERASSLAPYTPFTVDRWLELAEATIADLRSRNILPIVVGGTHLYVKALLEGLFEGPEPNPALRAELNAMDPAARRAELERVDPHAAARIHPNDVRRTVRALEVFRQTGKPISAHQTQWDRRESKQSSPASAGGAYLLTILDWPSELINPRINARVKQMIERGLVAEARALYESGALGPQAIEALGYKQLIPHFLGQSSLEDAVEQIKIETRRFAKNQRTWLRRLRTTPGSLTLEFGDVPVADPTRRLLVRLMETQPPDRSR